MDCPHLTSEQAQRITSVHWLKAIEIITQELPVIDLNFDDPNFPINAIFGRCCGKLDEVAKSLKILVFDAFKFFGHHTLEPDVKRPLKMRFDITKDAQSSAEVLIRNMNCDPQKLKVLHIWLLQQMKKEETTKAPQ